MTLLAVIDIFQTNRVDKGLYLGEEGKNKYNILEGCKSESLTSKER